MLLCEEPFQLLALVSFTEKSFNVLEYRRIMQNVLLLKNEKKNCYLKRKAHLKKTKGKVISC